MAKIEKSYLIDGKSKEFVYTAHSVEKFTLTEKNFVKATLIISLDSKTVNFTNFLSKMCVSKFRESTSYTKEIRYSVSSLETTIFRENRQFFRRTFLSQ